MFNVLKQKHMSFNISDARQRKVKCVMREQESSWFFPNGGKLTVGHVYNVQHVEVKPWDTWVFLKEFPNIHFNSAHFEELEDYVAPQKDEKAQGNTHKEVLLDFLRIIGRKPEVIYKGKSIPPKLVCSDICVVNLVNNKEKLSAMSENDVFIIGRSSDNFPLPLDVKIDEYGGIISRVQAYILKEDERFVIYDPSLNGNDISF